VVQDDGIIYFGRDMKEQWGELGRILKDKYKPFYLYSSDDLCDEARQYMDSLESYYAIAIGNGGRAIADYMGIEAGVVNARRPECMINASGDYESIPEWREFFPEEMATEEREMMSGNNEKRLVLIDDVIASGATVNAVCNVLGLNGKAEAVCLMYKIKRSPYRCGDSLMCCNATAVIAVELIREELENEITLWETKRFLERYACNDEFIEKYFADPERAKRVIEEMKEAEKKAKDAILCK